MKNIPTFEEFLNESSLKNDQVYFQQNTLWYSWSPGSGITKQIKGDPDKFRGYITDKKDDSNFDGIAENIVKWSIENKHLSHFKSMSKFLFKIPCWWGYKSARDLSIWAGDLDPDYQPDYFLWMLVSVMGSGNSIINFFKTKQEAVNFSK